MADVNINKFRASVVRDGSKPSSPGFIVSEGQDPVNPPGTNNYVPYSGATANVELGEYGVEAGFITLDTTPTNTPTDQGTIFWDADDETVDIVLNGYTMKIGEDLFYPVKNQTGSTIAKGVAVRFNGTVGNSGRLLIAPFIADGSVVSSRFMGVTAEEILNGEDGKVLYFGRVRGINTNAFNEGDILYASTTSAGGYQTAIPVAPNNIVQVAAVVTKSATVGTIFVRPTLGSNINKDEGVKIVSVADKNLLQYQSGTSLWENKSLAQVLGGTSAQFVKGDGSLDSTSYGTGTVTSVGLSSATSGVTIGSTPVTTSGTITLAIATASGSQNGLLSSTDWTTFNSKQNALTNPVTGTGTTNYLPKFTGASTIGNSNIQDSGSLVSVGVAANFSSSVTSLSLDVISASGVGSSAATGLARFITAGTSNGIAVGQSNSSRYTAILANQLTIYNDDFFMRTNGNFPLSIGTNDATNLRVFSDGNVLIQTGGTFTNNGARLQVSGDITTTVNGGGGGLRLTLNNTGAGEVAYSVLSGGPAGTGIFGIRNSTTGTNLLLINGSGAATFSGDVTISKTSPTFRLTRGTTSASSLLVYNTNGTDNWLVGTGVTGSNTDYRVYNNSLGTDAIYVLNSNNNVGIGTSSPTGGKLVVSANSSGETIRMIGVDTIGDNYLTFVNTSATRLGYIGYGFSASNEMTISNDSDAPMSFYTNAAERMRITSVGRGLFGTTTPSAGASGFGSNSFQVNNEVVSMGSLAGLFWENRSGGVTASSNWYGWYTTSAVIYLYNGAANIASINTSTGAYTALSDINKKENFEASKIGLKEVLNLKPTIYSIKNDTKKERHLGFIAQEVRQYIPNAYVENGEFIGLNEMPIIAALTKAIQELKQEIDTLKN